MTTPTRAAGNSTNSTMVVAVANATRNSTPAATAASTGINCSLGSSFDENYVAKPGEEIMEAGSKVFKLGDSKKTHAYLY